MGVLRDSLAGAVGGLAGAWAMQQFRLRWDGRAHASADSGIFGLDEESDIGAVDQVCAAFQLAVLSREEALHVALWLHYGYGLVSGAAYGAAVAKRPATSAGFGIAFGIGLWLIGDEFAMAATGLSDPFARKASSHGSALLAHLLFGVVTEGGRRVIFSVLPPAS